MSRVVGIAGGTGSGKSALAQALRSRFDEVCVVELDSYYLDRRSLPSEQRIRINYDEPAAIEVPLLLDHLERLASGSPVTKPVYSFQLHERVGTEVLRPAALIIVEGLFTLCWEALCRHLDLKVFVDAPADVRLGRRILRDVVERGRTVDTVLEQYFRIVRPMHDRYVEPTRARADVVVLNTGPVEACLEGALEIERALAIRGTLVGRPPDIGAPAPADA
jgi:uridine kinase